MEAMNAEALLRVWEETGGAHMVRRALALLDAAWPELGLQNWARAPIGERDGCLLQLREALFGKQLQTVSCCPRCGERIESEFTTQDIRTQPPALPAPRTPLRLQEQGHDISYRLPNSEDLLLACDDAGVADGVAATLLRRCVIEARCGGLPLDAAALPAGVVQKLAGEMEQRDPGAEIRMALTCPACNQAWSASFDIVSYLWGEIEDWAQRLLADVHTLAGSYNWSERDILALSPARRQFYLDMVRA